MKTHLWFSSPTKKLTKFTANKELKIILDERIKLIEMYNVLGNDEYCHVYLYIHHLA